MATQSDAFQRTEQPTRLRLIEARRRGQVARSRDLTGAAVLVAAVIVVCLGGGAMIGELTAMMSRMLTFSPSEYVSGRTAQRAEIHQPRAERTAIRQERRPGLSSAAIWAPVGPVVQIAVLFCGIVFAAALLAGIAQVGLRIATPALHPRWDRLSPAAGFRRLVSSRGLVRASLAVAKIAAVFLIAAVTICDRLPEISSACGLSISAQAASGYAMAGQLAWKIVLVLLVLGGVDWMYQWRQHRRELMMTRREVLEDLRRTEGDPLMRSRRRRRRRGARPAGGAGNGQDVNHE